LHANYRCLLSCATPRGEQDVQPRVAKVYRQELCTFRLVTPRGCPTAHVSVLLLLLCSDHHCALSGGRARPTRNGHGSDLLRSTVAHVLVGSRHRVGHRTGQPTGGSLAMLPPSPHPPKTNKQKKHTTNKQPPPPNGRQPSGRGWITPRDIMQAHTSVHDVATTFPCMIAFCCSSDCHPGLFNDVATTFPCMRASCCSSDCHPGLFLGCGAVRLGTSPSGRWSSAAGGLVYHFGRHVSLRGPPRCCTLGRS